MHGIKGNCQKIYSLDENRAYIDSIASIIKSTSSDSIKCLYSYKVALLHLKAQNIQEYKDYLHKANTLKNKFPFLKDVAFYYNAYEPYLKGDIDGFERELGKANLALKKYANVEAYRLRSITLQNIGILYQMKNKEAAFMDILVNEAIPVAKKSGDNEVICNLYKGIGNVLLNTNQFEKAEEYLKQAMHYIEKENKESPTLLESKLDTNIIYAEILVELNKLNEAKQKLDKIYSLLKNYPNSNLNGSYYYVEGLYYSKLKDYKKALKSFDLGIIKQSEVQNTNGINRIKFRQYQVYFELKEYTKARDILEYLIENNPQIIDKKNNYNELAKVYEAIGDSKKAYFYAKKYTILNDSLNKSMFQEQILEMEAKFNKFENENKIKLLEFQKEKVEIIAKNNRFRSFIFGVLSVILLAAVALLWKLNSNQKKLNKQKELNYKQELAVFENQQKLNVAKALLEGEEVERKRIARDLHDGLGSMLSRLKMYFNKLKQENNKVSEEINSLLDSSIKELRGVSQNLMPEALLKLGLEEALRDLCFASKTPENKIEFQFLAQNLNLPKNKEIAIYRIIQELLNNALKYAKATEILVSCSENKNVFYITVEDNGIGFKVDEVENKDHMGLKNISYRVAFLEGKLEIDSHPNKGTSIYIEIINK